MLVPRTDVRGLWYSICGNRHAICRDNTKSDQTLQYKFLCEEYGACKQLLIIWLEAMLEVVKLDDCKIAQMILQYTAV